MKSRKPARGCSEESEDAIAARETEWLPVRVARLRERSERAQRYQFEIADRSARAPVGRGTR